METNLKLALQKAACGVFEELAFMMLARDLDEVQKNAAFRMASTVNFHGPVSGRLVLAIYGDLVPTMASNMLGDLDVPTEFQQMDALKEMTNVICGNMLPHLLGEKAVYKIDAPSIIDETSVFLTEPGAPAEQLEYGIEHGRALLRLSLVDDQKKSEQGT